MSTNPRDILGARLLIPAVLSLSLAAGCSSAGATQPLPSAMGSSTSSQSPQTRTGAGQIVTAQVLNPLTAALGHGVLSLGIPNGNAACTPNISNGSSVSVSVSTTITVAAWHFIAPCQLPVGEKYVVVALPARASSSTVIGTLVGSPAGMTIPALVRPDTVGQVFSFAQATAQLQSGSTYFYLAACASC